MAGVRSSDRGLDELCNHGVQSRPTNLQDVLTLIKTATHNEGEYLPSTSLTQACFYPPLHTTSCYTLADV